MPDNFAGSISLPPTPVAQKRFIAICSDGRRTSSRRTAAASRACLSDRDVGSIYQLRETLLDNGMTSHWTPYVRVNDIEHAAGRATQFGGKVVVDPFLVSDVARIALILDSVGAVVGLWEPIAADKKANGHG